MQQPQKSSGEVKQWGCCRTGASLALRYLTPRCCPRAVQCGAPEAPGCTVPWRWPVQTFWGISENRLCKGDETITITPDGLQT